MSTTHDIARLAGVSRATVDRVLNNRSYVNAETRKKVMQAIKELQYRPNFIASSLSRKRTNTIGIIVFDLGNRFIAQMADAAETHLRELGYFSHFVFTHKDMQTEVNCIRHLRERRVDGIIILPVGQDNTINELKGLSVVTIGNRLDNLLFVGIDEFEAGAMAARHIKEKGYESVVFVSPPLAEKDFNNVWAQEQRYLGFISETPVELITEYSFENLLTGYIKGKTAFFFSTDKYALRALLYFKKIGLKPCKDVGVMGFDNIDTLEYFEPKLNTVSFPIEMVGKTAAERVVAMIEGAASEDMLFNAVIVDGQTL